MTPSNPPTPRERAINIPTALLVAMASLVVIHAVRTWLDDATDARLLIETAFVPAAWSVSWGVAAAQDVLEAVQREGGDPDLLALRLAWARYLVAEGSARPWTWLSYALLHGSWTHLVLNGVWLAAFGSPVVRRAGALRSLLLAAAAAVGGALAQWVTGPLGVQPMIGLSAAVSGLMAAAATFVFARPAGFPGGYPPGRRQARPDWSFLGNRNVVVFLGIWLLANVLFGLVAVPLGIADGAGIAWQAHIGGLLVGLALFPLIDPGPHTAA
ncbi:rhomboid family intramembrane serine protease [Enterovirga sp.]|uniref:rhomboid family intramembrane serine protease n=1 Tax=Enterovirga sp. TaxID=2026350 RepID=UPI002614511B|nr:rhomboid family intramembrane serine protease [Enterovirga sp.]MDB5592775.1 rhomboid family intrarane serine protease [Enterovirga sp.]